MLEPAGRGEARSQIRGVRRWYDTVARTFVQRYAGDGGRYYRLFEEDEFLLHVPEGAFLLDLGCGHGRFAERVTRTARNRAVGVDLSLEMLRQAGKTRFPRVQADATLLPFGDATFDVVVSMGMFEYLEDPSPFLSEIRRVLRVQGTLVLTFHQIRPSFSPPPENGDSTYFGRTLRERDALWRKARHTLRALRDRLDRAGFEIVAVRRIFFDCPARLYGIACRIGGTSQSLARWTISASVTLERLLSRYFSVGSNGNTVLAARRR